MNSLSQNASGALLGLASFAVFAVHDVIVKQLGSTYSPFQILFFTALLSFPILTLVLIKDQKPDTLRPRHPYWIAIRSLSGAASGICAFFAFSKLPLSEVYAFFFASPLLITLLAIPLLGEKVRLRRGLAVLLGLGGVLIVLQPGASALTSGHIAALAAAFASALASIIVRKIGSEERGVVMILYPMMTNLALTAMMLPFVYIEIPLADFGLLAIDTLLVLLAMWLLVGAYAKTTAIIVAPMQYSQIIWATLFGIMLFGEYPEWHVYLGTSVIVLSGLYILKRETDADVSQNSPVTKTKTRTGYSGGMRVGQVLRRRR